MELTMTNGFSELSFNEMEMVDGGGPWEWLDNFVEGFTDHSIGEISHGWGEITKKSAQIGLQTGLKIGLPPAKAAIKFAANVFERIF